MPDIYFIPAGPVLSERLGAAAAGLTGNKFFANPLPATLGNIIGGVVFAAFVFWYARRK